MLLLTDWEDDGNGGATPLPRSLIQIGMAPLNMSYYINPSSERYRQLFKHEYTHIVMTDKYNRRGIYAHRHDRQVQSSRPQLAPLLRNEGGHRQRPAHLCPMELSERAPMVCAPLVSRGYRLFHGDLARRWCRTCLRRLRRDVLPQYHRRGRQAFRWAPTPISMAPAS